MPNDVNDGLTQILDDLLFFVVVRRKVTMDDVKASFKTNVVLIKKAAEFLIKFDFIRQEDDYLYPSHHLDLLLADFLSNRTE